MYKTLLLQLRVAFTLALAAPLMIGCDSETTEPVPAAAPVQTAFSLVDSMKVAPWFKDSHPDLFQKYQSKTYHVAAANQAEVYFFEENNGITLYFKDTSNQVAQSWLTLHFKNRTVENLPATLSLKETQEVCVQNGQSFKDGSAALSPSCVTALNGVVSLRYDAATKVLSGSISNLALGLDYYVPDYAFPNRAGNVFKASGSTRHLNITFENVKGRKIS